MSCRDDHSGWIYNRLEQAMTIHCSYHQYKKSSKIFIFATFMQNKFETNSFLFKLLWCVSFLADEFLLFVRVRHHIGASEEKRKEASPILYFYVPLYDVLSLNNSTFCDFVDCIYLAKNETLRQKRLFQFSLYEMSIDTM